MKTDYDKLCKEEEHLIDEAEKRRGKWIISLSGGEIKRVDENFDYDVVPDYFNDWRDGRKFDDFNWEVLVHVLLHNYLFKLNDGNADKKGYISTLRKFRERKQELEEDIEASKKELEKIDKYIERLESFKTEG